MIDRVSLDIAEVVYTPLTYLLDPLAKSEPWATCLKHPQQNG